MTLLIIGLLLWSLPHLFKRLAPNARAKMGDKARGPVALATLAGLILMVIGYRAADGAVLWGRSPALTGINNLLMIGSIYLFAASGMQTALARKMRHPMLWGMALWAIAHLLVNGDTPSFVLFGGLLVWAFLEMALINRAQPWTPPAAKARKFEFMALGGTVIVYAVIAAIHALLGYSPFG
ncbi:MAG: NnrU family protein [Maritimibacter sp.]